MVRPIDNLPIGTLSYVIINKRKVYMPATSFSFDDDLKTRIESLLVGTESISQFAYSAVIEKCNRMEKRNDDARKAVYKRDVELFKPIIRDIIEELKKE